MKFKNLLIMCMLLVLFASCKNYSQVEELYKRAKEEYSKQEFEDSLNTTKKILSLDKNFYHARFLKSKILFFTEDYKNAEKELKKLCKKHPEFTEARLYLNRVLLQQNKLEEAEKMLLQELSLNQSDWRFYYQYALLAKKSEKLETLLSMCRRAEQVLSDTEKVYIEMAEFWIRLGRQTNAIRELDKASLVSNDSKSIEELKKTLINLNAS